MRPMWLVAAADRDRRFSTRARAESYAAKHGGQVHEGVGDRYGWRRARLDPTTGAEVVEIVNRAPSLIDGDNYTAREQQANRNRDTRNDGSCAVCEAPLGIWCDAVVHAQAVAS